MSLRDLRDRLSVTQIVIACAAVALGGGARWYSLSIAGALAVLALWRPLPPVPSTSSQRLWTLGVLAALVASIARAFVRAEFLDAGVDFILLLVVQRLFNRQHAREHMQLLLLGVLLMVVGAVINTGLDYPFLFSAYVLVTVMTLIVNHLLSEGERLGPRIMHEVMRQGARRQRELWRAAAGVTSLAGAGALFVFLVFPRFGVGVFLRGDWAKDARSGFSSEVRLGDFGTIKNDATVVMHLVPLTPIEHQERLTWHLRGSSFDHYEDGLWSQSRHGETVGTRRFYGYDMLAPDNHHLVEADTRREVLATEGRVIPVARSIPEFAASTDTLRVMVMLEDIGTELAFVASEPLGVRLHRRGRLERRMSIAGGYNRQLRILGRPPGAIQYEFVSRIGTPTREELLAIGDPPVRPRADGPFLQRSARLSPEVSQTAQRITQGATTRLDKVEAVMRYLRNFRYTVDLRRSDRVEAGADPLEGFLFDTQAGHCEYFATAMAVLLREVGVPTRNVNGYYGAHFNGLGDFYAVRQADAHSWVEVHFGELGWVTFDPTPPSGRLAGDDAPYWPALSRLFDATRSAYLEYVVDFDLGKQRALLDVLGLRGGGEGRDAATREKPTLPFGIAPFHLAWIAPLCWVAMRMWLRRGTDIPEHERIYGRLLRLLERRGHHRRVHESPTSFAQRLTREGVPEGPPMAQFAIAYEAVRFGPAGETVDRDDLVRRLRKAARAVEKPSRATIGGA